MSKSVEAHYKGQIVSARDLPTGCQQRCSLVAPTVPPRYLTEPSAKSPQTQPAKRPERERSSGPSLSIVQHDGGQDRSLLGNFDGPRADRPPTPVEVPPGLTAPAARP
jgi:hypothetical protein